MFVLKDNHPTLHEDIATWLDDCDARGDVRQIESIDKDHGRLERRRVVVNTELDWLEAKPEWAGLKAVAMVEPARITQASHDYRCQILFGENTPSVTRAT